MYHFEENLPYPCGSQVFYINDSGISRGKVISIQVRIDEEGIERSWQVVSWDDGECTRFLPLKLLAVTIEHALEIAASTLPNFMDLKNVAEN